MSGLGGESVWGVDVPNPQRLPAHLLLQAGLDFDMKKTQAAALTEGGMK